MFHTLLTTPSKTKFLHKTQSHAPPRKKLGQKPPQTPRQLSTIGSDSYNRSLRRAFSRAKLLAYFNPDLTLFITLTYQSNILDHTQVLHDIKQLLKTQKRHNTKHTPPKYIYVLEHQKRGSIHVHMVANDAFTTFQNANGYASLLHWKHGYSSVLRISQTDHNFKPFLYLFKYMHKAERIGSSFIHTSRNFAPIVKVDYQRYISALADMDLLYEEDSEIFIDQVKITSKKRYLSKREIQDASVRRSPM